MEPHAFLAFWYCKRDDSSQVDITLVVWDRDSLIFFQSELLNGDTCDFM